MNKLPFRLSTTKPKARTQRCELVGGSKSHRALGHSSTLSDSKGTCQLCLDEFTL